MEYLIVIFASYGIAAVLASGKAGPIKRVRDWITGWSDSEDWKYLWSCGMCLSVWIGAVLGIAAAGFNNDPWFLFTPAVTPGLFRLTAALENRHG